MNIIALIKVKNKHHIPEALKTLADVVNQNPDHLGSGGAFEGKDMFGEKIDYGCFDYKIEDTNFVNLKHWSESLP